MIKHLGVCRGGGGGHLNRSVWWFCHSPTCLTTNTFNTSLNYAILRGLRENLQEDNVDNLPKSKASTSADWTSMRFAPRNLRIVAVSLCYYVNIYVTACHLRHDKSSTSRRIFYLISRNLTD